MTVKRTDNFPVHEEQEDGWSVWVSPHHESYQMACCDCGLIHEMQFKVVRFTGEKHDDGDEHCEPADDPDVQAIFRARRHGILPDSELRVQLAAANVRQAELAAELTKERARLDWALKHGAKLTGKAGGLLYNLSIMVQGYDFVAATEPRTTIDELIAAEAAGGSDERA